MCSFPKIGGPNIDTKLLQCLLWGPPSKGTPTFGKPQTPNPIYPYISPHILLYFSGDHQKGYPYLGGQGDLRLIMGINGVTIWVLGVISLLTKSP